MRGGKRKRKPGRMGRWGFWRYVLIILGSFFFCLGGEQSRFELPFMHEVVISELIRADVHSIGRGLGEVGAAVVVGFLKWSGTGDVRGWGQGERNEGRDSGPCLSQRT